MPAARPGNGRTSAGRTSSSRSCGEQLQELTKQYETDVKTAEKEAREPRIEPYPVRLRKGDVAVDRVVLAWTQ